MINHEHKCIFIHVTKNAGTSIILAFGRKWRDESHDTAFLNDGVLSEQSKKRWESAMLQYKDYFVFAVIRNPWDRFISGWKYCASTKDKDLDTVLSHLPTFEENAHDNRHITVPQRQRLYDGNILIPDFLIRFENLQADFNLVCDKIGKPRVKLAKENSTEHDHYRTYFNTPERRAKFESLFGIDIETFGYTF